MPEPLEVRLPRIWQQRMIRKSSQLPSPNDQPVPIPQQATKPNVGVDLINRFKDVFLGWSGWYSPGLPLAPQAPEEFPRTWQFPVGYNLQYTPRSTEQTTFATLREFARTYDVLASIILRKIAFVTGLEWDIITKKDVDGTKYRDEIKALKRFFERPDKTLEWPRWLAMLMRDRLEIDAASLFVERTRGGQIYAIQQVDGSAIKPILDARGMVPKNPVPGYEAVFYGLPRSLFTDTQLLYRPQNVHIDSAYGFSETEAIMFIVNMMLRKRIKDLEHFTDGNTPEAMVGFPENYTAEDMRQWMEQFDERMAGNLAMRSRITPMPMSGGRGTIPIYEFRPFTGDPIFDDACTKIALQAHLMTPSEFGITDDVNRASSEGQEDVNERTWQKPVTQFIASIMNLIIQGEDFFNQPDLLFQFNLGQSQDKLVEAQTAQIYVAMGALFADEVREKNLGLPPIGIPPAIPVSGQVMSLEQYKQMLAQPAQAPWGPGGDGKGGPPSDANDKISPDKVSGMIPPGTKAPEEDGGPIQNINAGATTDGPKPPEPPKPSTFGKAGPPGESRDDSGQWTSDSMSHEAALRQLDVADAIPRNERYSPIVDEFRRDGRRSIRGLLNGTMKPLASARDGEHSVHIMPDHVKIYQKDGWSPAAGGSWQDWPEKHWGLKSAEYRQLPVEQRAALEANEQLKYVPDQFHNRWLETYHPNEADRDVHKADDSDGNWKTINGTHVLLDDDGTISKGPEYMVGKHVNDIGVDDREADQDVANKHFKDTDATSVAAIGKAWIRGFILPNGNPVPITERTHETVADRIYGKMRPVSGERLNYGTDEALNRHTNQVMYRASMIRVTAGPSGVNLDIHGPITRTQEQTLRDYAHTYPDRNIFWDVKHDATGDDASGDGLPDLLRTLHRVHLRKSVDCCIHNPVTMSKSTGSGHSGDYDGVDIDFHQTISDALKSPSLGEPKEGAIQAIQAFLDHGLTVYISCGGLADSDGDELEQRMRTWLTDHGITDLSHVQFRKKPRTLAVIDDKAICPSDGDWSEIQHEVLSRQEKNIEKAEQDTHWRTINGAHVLLDDSGDITKGPARLVGKNVNKMGAPNRDDDTAALQREWGGHSQWTPGKKFDGWLLASGDFHAKQTEEHSDEARDVLPKLTKEGHDPGVQYQRSYDLDPELLELQHRTGVIRFGGGGNDPHAGIGDANIYVGIGGPVSSKQLDVLKDAVMIAHDHGKDVVWDVYHAITGEDSSGWGMPKLMAALHHNGFRKSVESPPNRIMEKAPDPIVLRAARDDLRRWRTVASKAVKENLPQRVFTSDVIPPTVKNAVSWELDKLGTMSRPARLEKVQQTFYFAADMLEKAEASGCHWVTLHAGGDENSGTVHVCIRGGKIMEGPKALAGHDLDNLDAVVHHHPDPTNHSMDENTKHRQDTADGKATPGKKTVTIHGNQHEIEDEYEPDATAQYMNSLPKHTYEYMRDHGQGPDQWHAAAASGKNPADQEADVYHQAQANGDTLPKPAMVAQQEREAAQAKADEDAKAQAKAPVPKAKVPTKNPLHMDADQPTADDLQAHYKAWDQERRHVAPSTTLDPNHPLRKRLDGNQAWENYLTTAIKQGGKGANRDTASFNALNNIVHGFEGGAEWANPGAHEALYDAAAEEFGLKNPGSPKSANAASLKSAYDKLGNVDKPALKAVLRAMYDETQDELAKKGVKSLHLYRGEHTDDASQNQYPIASFTHDPVVASSYADIADAPAHVLHGNIPAERILTLPKNSAGMGDDAEFTVLGGDGLPLHDSAFDPGKAPLHHGKTAWDKLAATTSPKTPKPAAVAASAPVPKTQPATVHKLSEVAQNAVFSTRPDQKKQVDETLAEIDKIHGGEGLAPLRFYNGKGKVQNAWSAYNAGMHGIAIPDGMPQPHFTLAHEIGHYLDHMIQQPNGEWPKGTPMADQVGDDAEKRMFSSYSHPALQEWRDAVANSRASKHLDELQKLGKGKVDRVAGYDGQQYQAPPGGHLPQSYINYLHSTPETFARSYAQWVASKSQHPEMQKEWAEAQKNNGYYGEQWDDQDFKPIGKALDHLFQKKGWMS